MEELGLSVGSLEDLTGGLCWVFALGIGRWQVLGWMRFGGRADPVPGL